MRRSRRLGSRRLYCPQAGSVALVLQSSQVREFIEVNSSVCFTHEVRASVPLNHGRHAPFPSPHQVHGVLDLCPPAPAHPCGMPCIFKQVLHFEISSRRDISRRLNIYGSRIRQPSECKYQPAPHQAALGVSRKVLATVRPSPSVSVSTVLAPPCRAP